MTCTCGERMMLADPATLAFAHPPTSIDARRLLIHATSHRGVLVWTCDYCDRWIPTA